MYVSLKKNNCKTPYCNGYSVSYVLFCLCAPLAGQKELCAIDCSCILVAVPCILVASVCACLYVYIGWPVVAWENGKSLQQKKSILLCGSSVVTPVLSTADVHEVVGA